MSSLHFRLCRSIADLAEAFELYLKFGGNWLPVPDPDDLNDVMRERRLIGCWHKDALIAVGGLFEVARCTDDGVIVVQVYELAGSVVNPDYRGLGIQRLLVALRSYVLASEQYQNVALIASVAVQNSASGKNMGESGMIRLEDSSCPVWLKDVRRTWMAGLAPPVHDYIMPGRQIGRFVELLADVSKNGLARTQKPDDRHPCDFDPELFNNAPTPVEDLRPLWLTHVPAVRLIGRKPKFHRWPR